MRCARPFAQDFEACLRDEYARMHTNELGFEGNLVREQIVNPRNGLLRQSGR